MKHSFLGKSVFFVLLGVLAGGVEAHSITLEVSNAPTDNLSLTTNAILSAKKSILMNIYELSSASVASAILSQIKAGIQINILEEGSPVGGLSTASKGIQSQIAQAMKAKSNGSHLYEMKAAASSKRRYRFDHAKYAVIDGASLLIGSENYSPTGNPEPGSLGNRGWEVLIHDPALSAEFASTFAADSSLSYGDVTDLTAGTVFKNAESFESASLPINKAILGTAPSLDASSIQKITSPDTSQSGLLQLLNQAKNTLDIELMTFDPAWETGNQSPLLDAVIAAAKRGVTVRVLVNDDNVFSNGGTPPKPKNSLTVSDLNQAAQTAHLKLTARTANVKGMGVDYIHNKGVIADGNQTLISSMNWDLTSITENREAAVLITSPAVYQYYETLFNQDWSVSAKTLSPLNAISLTAQSDCPNLVDLEIKIGSIVMTDSEDADFQTLSNQTIKDKFVRVPSESACLFTNHDKDNVEVGGHQTLELRQKSDGTRTIIFEGYTPKSKKIYSVRTSLDPQSDWLGSHSAIIYDGSSPSREKIGSASIAIK